MSPTGRPKKIGPEHHPLLREIVTAKPLASISEIGAAFTRRTGVRMHRNTLADALAEAGIKRIHKPRTAAEKQTEVQPDQSGRFSSTHFLQCSPDSLPAGSFTATRLPSSAAERGGTGRISAVPTRPLA